MSAYELQRYMYDWLKSRDGRTDSEVLLDSYGLDVNERAAVEKVAVASLLEQGVHPVLIMQFARGNGKNTSELRSELATIDKPPRKDARWRS